MPNSTCQVSWTENGEVMTDGKPAVAMAHLFYRDNAAHPSLEVAVCEDHYNQLSSRQYDVGLGARRPDPVYVTVTYTRLAAQASQATEARQVIQPTLPARRSPAARAAAQITITPGTATLGPLETQQFTQTVTGLTSTAVIWSAAQGTIDQTGLYTAPNSATATVDTITAISAVNRCVKATVQVSIAAPITVTVLVSPPGTTLNAGQTQQYTAVVVGIGDQTVTWSMGVGSAGTISAAGLYTAPASLGVQAVDTVIATSVGYPLAQGQGSITINPNVGVSITPGAATVITNATQQFSATVAGVGSQVVTWAAQLGTITQTGLYTAPATAGIDNVTATSQAFPSAVSTVAVNVTTGTGVTVTVTPVTVTLNPGQTQQFSAVVNGLTNQSVVWSLHEFNVPIMGTISATGLYTAPASNQTVFAADEIIATSVPDPAAQGLASANINVGGAAQLDLVQWMLLSSRSSQHLVGDPSAPYAVQVIDTDAIYPANYPRNCVWEIKNKLGNPWDVHTYNQNFITHWITENGDSVDQAACQAANGTSCWMYARAYKRYLTPVNVMPRFFTPGTTITIDNPSPNDVNATTNCETSAPRVVHIGAVRGITTGPFKISWGGSIDHGTGTLASGPNYDPVNGVDTIRVQYQYSGNPTSGFADDEEYYYVLGFGEVAWYYYHAGAFVQKTVNTTLAATGAPVPNFPCGPGKTWFV